MVEQKARKIAESIWGAVATPERESGVKCDAIVKYRSDYWILIEVSKRDGLDKLRDDLAKFAVMRTALMARGIYSECYFITSGNHSSLKESGVALNVEVLDLDGFATKFLGSRFYTNERLLSPFGSAVDPDTGKVDKAKYIEIKYVDKDGAQYGVSDIARKVESGAKIVLVGEFGSGKSRCLMEVFSELSACGREFVPVAINLRDNWGYKRLSHIISNHLDSLGLGDYADNLVRSLRRGNHVLLLDGFDEIGSQSWSGDPARLTEIRKKSLEGVRDVIQSCPGSGMLITGREHYFNSDDEMAECLGLKKSEIILLKCPEEFSEGEVRKYIEGNTSLKKIPEWMPRKPLIFQLLSRLDPAEVERLHDSANGEVEFFESILDAICKRETRISPTVYADALKGILLALAQKTREKRKDDERISNAEINQAFYDIVGYAPIDESAALLQRLPYLGRIGTGGAERIFIDDYAKDGLRAISLSQSLSTSSKEIASLRWQQALGTFGLRVLSSKVKADQGLEKFIRYCATHGNSQVACDYIALILGSDNRSCDFRNLSVSGGAFELLSFVDVRVSGLRLDGVEIDTLEIESASFSNVFLSDCVISAVNGIGSVNALPEIFQNCVFGKFQGAYNSSRISKLNLCNAHKTLLSIIKKLFFQKGGGRQEDALLRGAEDYWDSESAEKVLHYMVSNKIAIKANGNHGLLYVPRRSHTRRMARIWELQTSCGDELWDMLN
ncbi:hypothetical protein [Azospirillum sp. ST 5-10]|uniref:hypothetical protein n=1 Tax=unclassified Azospirillum TaxID=2630922 RepID=UPI003F49F9CA